MNARIGEELTLLRHHFEKVEHAEADSLHWFLIEGVRTPTGWTPEAIQVAFSVTQGYPGVQPYGFFVPAELAFPGNPPVAGLLQQPPFGGQWRFLSTQPEVWHAGADVRSGSNLWGWVRSFTPRMQEGV